LAIPDTNVCLAAFYFNDMKNLILSTLLLIAIAVSAQIKTQGKNDAAFPTFY
jgi:hypothetical protein